MAGKVFTLTKKEYVCVDYPGGVVRTIELGLFDKTEQWCALAVPDGKVTQKLQGLLHGESNAREVLPGVWGYLHGDKKAVESNRVHLKLIGDNDVRFRVRRFRPKKVTSAWSA